MSKTNIFHILFGRGWYVWLYLLTYFWYFVFPGLLVDGYMMEYWNVAKAGGDFSGGLGMLIPLIFTPIVLCPVLIVSSTLWTITLRRSLWQKILIVVGISFIFPIAVGITGMYISNIPLYLLYYFSYFGLFALHLFMLDRWLARAPIR